jgi:hypothetical protein
MVDVSKDFPRATKKGCLWKVTTDDEVYKNAHKEIENILNENIEAIHKVLDV